jgi:trimeric autotransporter adhesin
VNSVTRFLRGWVTSSIDKAPPAAPAPLLMPLEPRIVYDASVAAVGATAHHQHNQPEPTAAAAHRATSESSAHSFNAPAAHVPAPADHVTSAPSRAVEPSARREHALHAQLARTQTVDTSNAQQVVFIDSNVADYQSLVAGLPAGTPYVVLNANTDGLQQIAHYLQQHPGVSSIHLVSHGSDADFQVGSTWINEADLSTYSAVFAQIGASMKPGGDFLIYGCDVAQNADGKALVQQIASITGLNVAASTDNTGAASLGGNWTLEYEAGNVHTGVAFSTAAEQNYDHLLALITENYDNQVGLDTGATPVASTVIDGLTYTGDQAVEYQVVGGSLPASGSGGELIVNTQGTQMSTMTVQRQDGSLMAVQSFDIDLFVSNQVTVEALDTSGTVIGSITLDVAAGSTPYTPGHTSSNSLFHVDLSSNAAFSQVKSLKLVETSGNGTYLSPTLDNFTYIDPSSPPALTATGGSTSFVAGDNVASTPVVVDSGITLTDGNSSTANSATVSITGNFHGGEDVLAFTNTSAATYGNIAAAYNSGTGVLTLTSASGTATIAQWQAAMRAVTYTDTAVTPNSATRTISFHITSDGLTSGNTTTKQVSVTDTDQTPIVTTTGATTPYYEGASATTIDSGVHVSDLDSTTQTSGTVLVAGGFHSGDTLSFTNNGSTMGNITASFNAATGVMTLMSAGATATDAQWANALSTVKFSSSSTTLGNRTISFATSDGTKTSTAATDTVSVVTPVQLTTDSGSAAFVAGDNTTSTPVVIDSGITLSDTATSTLATATVAITANYINSEDVLAFTNNGTTMGNISASFNSATGVMTLTSAGATATLAQWQSALRSITYTDTAVVPNSSVRTVSFTITDSLANTSSTSTRTVTVTDTDQTPILTTTGSTTSYVGASSAVTVDGGISVTDRDNTTQTSATVSVSGGFHSGDTLSFTNDGATMGNVAGSYNAGTGVMTLTSAGATATDSQWASALSAVRFSSTSTTYGNRTISFATSDGTKTSNAATDTVNITAPPKITTDSGSAAFVAGDNTASTPVAIDAGLTVTDGSATTLGTTTVAITGGFQSGEDVLAFTNDGATMGNITASYNAATGVMTLTSAGATATLAQWQSALQSVSYTDTAVTPTTTTRTISFTSVDGAGNTSATATRTVTITDTDQTPIVTTAGGTTNYVGGTSAQAIDGGISVSDLDNTTQSFGTVAITGGFHSGDTLTFVNTSSVTFGNIVASYNAATGVLTMTSSCATASDTQWANALSAVAFSAASSATPGNRTVSFAVSDGTKTSAVRTDTVAVLGPPSITTDSGSASFVAGDNMASTPVAVDSGLSLTDGTSPTLASATVAITGNFHVGEDVLAFTNTSSATYGNIGASYNAATGVLTLTSSGALATLAQWQAALASVTYTDTAITPNSTTRTISFTVVDTGAFTSNTATRTVTVTDTDQTPMVSVTGGTTNYVAGAPPETIDGTVTVSDSDNSTQSVGTVSITTGFHSGDTLSFANTSSALFGNIVASYDSATGVMTLTSAGATSSDAQWSHALAAVTFSATSSATPGTRTVSFTTNDGTKTSTVQTDTLDVLSPPIITTDPGSASFVAGDNVTSTPVAIDSGLTLTDGGAPTLASATVSLTGNFHGGEDVLAFTNSSGTTYGDITGSYDAATGVLTLTSAGNTATLVQWQSALEAVTYTDTAITPNNATRTISFTVVDTGAVTSNTATRTVTVADTDQTPIATTTSGTTDYVAGTSAATIDGGVTISDRDNTTQASATASITGGFNGGDTLAFTNTSSTLFGNITGSYNSAAGVLTLTSSGATATDTQWQNALEAITFANASSAVAGSRTVSFVINDGTKSSTTATKGIDVLGPPVVTTDSGSAAFSAGDNVTSTPVAIDSGLTLSDPGSGTFASTTVAITGNFQGGEDVLAFANDGSTMGNIVGSYNTATGVLTLSSSGATATLAQWQAAVQSVTYTDTAVTPNNAVRTISFTAIDGNGTVSNTATRAVTVQDTNQTPVLTTTGTATTYVGGTTATTVDSGVTLSDRDDVRQSFATVSVGTGFHSGDTLAFANSNATTYGNISGSYDSGTGVLTLTSAGSTATDAQWQSALDAVTFSTSASAVPGNRTVSFVSNDGIENSLAATRTVNVIAPPLLTAGSGSASFVAGDNVASAPVVVDSGITVADAGSTTLASAAVSITGNFHSGEDVLAFANDASTMGNIAGSYDGTTGILTLKSSGTTATLAQWQAALAAVTYTDTAISPDNASRTISFNVVDGNGNSSNIATRDVGVQDTDQTPIVATTSGSAGYTPGLAPTVVDSGIVISDRDNTTLASATISVSAGFQPGDQLSLTPAGNAQYGNITASYDPANGVLTLNSIGGVATLAQWQQALDAVQFATSPANPQSSRTISFIINDGTAASVAATRNVTFLTPPFAPPVVASSSAPLAGAADTSKSTVSHEPTKDIVITELEPHTTSATAPPAQTAVFSGNSLDGGLSGVSTSGTRAESGINVPTWLQPMSDWSATVTTGPAVHLDAPAGQAFSLTLAPPASHSDGLEFGTTITTTVEQLDGTPLPDWMHYDAAAGVLSGTAPRGEQHEVVVVVIKHDGAGHVIRREIVVDFGRHATRDGHTGKQPQASVATPDRTPPASKPSLAEQFARERNTLHVSRQHAPRPDRSA